VTASLIADLPPTSGYIVFYIATPASIATLASPVLRQVFSAAKRALKNSSESQILFQFVPESMVLSSITDDPTSSRLEAFVSSIYDRILKPVDRSMSRRFSEHAEKVRKFFQDPAFVLGRPRQQKVLYVQQAPVLSLDVLDRHTLLHVGYRVSSCSRWLFAVCVDQRGENHELGVWLTQHEEGSLESFLVGQLWNFAISVAKGANIEWRIVFSKLGTMGEREMDGEYSGVFSSTKYLMFWYVKRG
jgi:mediator of RNA polymerase II transcription subunit 13, fungi type